jgi:hypothetical protein
MIKKAIYVTLIMICVSILTFSCSNDDDGNKNKPPGIFTLVTEGAVIVTPNLIWFASTDPDGDQVFYDVYLSKVGDDLIIIANDLATTNYQISGGQTLEVNTSYKWQVVAKDGNGGETSSDLGNLATMN